MEKTIEVALTIGQWAHTLGALRQTARLFQDMNGDQPKKNVEVLRGIETEICAQLNIPGIVSL